MITDYFYKFDDFLTQIRIVINNDKTVKICSNLESKTFLEKSFLETPTEQEIDSLCIEAHKELLKNTTFVVDGFCTTFKNADEVYKYILDNSEFIEFRKHHEKEDVNELKKRKVLFVIKSQYDIKNNRIIDTFSDGTIVSYNKHQKIYPYEYGYFFISKRHSEYILYSTDRRKGNSIYRLHSFNDEMSAINKIKNLIN